MFVLIIAQALPAQNCNFEWINTATNFNRLLFVCYMQLRAKEKNNSLCQCVFFFSFLSYLNILVE